MSRLIRRWFECPVTTPPSARKRPLSPRARLLVQALEGRVVPANFPVTNSLDSGAGSLRQAILDANANPGADTITFNAAVTGPIVLTTGELAVTDDLTITGPGAAGTAPTLVIDGNAAGRVFNLENTAGAGNVTLSGLIVQNGATVAGALPVPDGAGIFASDENVTLDRMIVRNNRVTGATNDSGGGIAAAQNAGLLTIRNTTVSGNTTTGRGGGIYFFENGSLLLENSTVSGNVNSTSTNGGGGIYFYGVVGAGGFTVRNSTISGNRSNGGSGGGIVLRGTAAAGFTGTALIQNSTITNNSSGTTGTGVGAGGGGISVPAGPGTNTVLTIVSSIVSGNSATAANGRSDIAVVANTTVNVNNSAIGDADGFTLSGTSGSNLAFGAALNLGPLADNGGPTFTHALPAGSPALNAGSNPAGLTTDQRGAGVDAVNFPRVVGAAADIGAYERSASAPPSAAGTFANVTAAGAATYTFQVTYTDGTAINTSSLNGSDVRVTGPNGFDQLATFDTSNPTTNAPSVVATYHINAPAGTFGGADVGTYTVSVEPNQVFNTAATPVAVPAGTLGTFQVLVPQTFTVTTTADAGAGSLRDALTKANAVPGTADTIAFAAGVTGTINLQTALPTVADGVTITGPGATALTVRRDPAAAADFRIFTIDAPGVQAVTISGVTISGGRTPTAAANGSASDGAGILLLNENLTLDRVVVSGNSAGTEGGGIGVASALGGVGGGTLTVRNSTVSGNTAAGSGSPFGGAGGGIYFANGGVLLLENSTVSGNTSVNSIGGGVYLYGAGGLMTATIRNSTIAGNSAAISGGGVMFVTAGTDPAQSLTIQNSTIANNTADVGTGGGLTQQGPVGTVTLQSTVIANNVNNTSPDVTGAVTADHSLIRDPAGVAFTDAGSNLPFGTDPLFAAAGLANNGGPTQTIALQNGSPLVNAGSNPANLTSDQRGFTPRVVGAAADIGAFEVGATAAAAPTVATVVVNGGGAQRSEVRSVVVTFSQVVNFAGGNANAAAAFTLSRLTGGGNVGLAASVATVGTQTVVTLTFTTANPAVVDAVSATGGASPSLADGRYQLAIADGAVTSAATGQALDGDANGTAGGAFVSPPDTAGSGAGFVFGLYRLFGDATGNGLVDLADLAEFRSTFNQTAPNPAYLAYLDADNSNTVDLADLSEFRSRFNQNLFTP